MNKKPCDYLGHIEVNLFPVLKFYFSEDDDSYFYCQSGNFRKYKRDSFVPVRTLYYKLPETFFVITYNDDLMLLKIKDGKFDGIGDINKDFVKGIPVLDTFGNVLRVETVNDIKVIKLEYERFLANELSSEKFISLWLDTDRIKDDVLMFGRYVDIFRTLYVQQNDEYIKFKSLFKNFLEKQELDILIPKYKNWLENEDLIPFKDIDKIIYLAMV